MVAPSEVMSMAALLASCAACASSVATFRTIREILRHKEAACRPYLAVKPFSINGRAKDDIFKRPSVVSKVVNLGRDSVKDISITVKDNSEEIESEINTVLASLDCGYSMKRSGSLSETRIVRKKEDQVSSVTLPCSTKINSCYIHHSGSIDFHLPYGFVFLALFLAKMSLRHESEELKLFLCDRLKLYIEISFHDIVGNIHSQKQIMKLQMAPDNYYCDFTLYFV